MRCAQLPSALLVVLAATLATPALALPGEVSNFRWCSGPKTCLQWDVEPAAAQYLLYRGERASLPCLLNPSVESCERGTFATTTTSGTIPELPPAGTFFWFLVTAEDGAGEGTPGAATAGPRQQNDTGACLPSCALAGASCSVDGDCCSSSCVAGTCQAACCQPSAGFCTLDSDCCSGACSGGLCQEPCSTAAQCPGTDTECRMRTCTAGVCGHSDVSAGTPTSTQLPGDCRQNQCDGSGNIVNVADNSDLPTDDGNQCTSEACVNGTPSHPAQPINSACNQGGGNVCDGAGNCVQCTSAAQCPGTDTECQQRTCSGFVCGISFAGAGSPCTQGGSVCDGAGACVNPPQVVSTTPPDAGSAPAGTTIAVTFSQAMNPATLTASTSAGACSGSIQVSLDAFSSCIAFSTAAASMSGGDTVATLVPQPGLLVNRTYQIRVTTAAQNASAVALASTFTQATGFTTTSPNLCDGSLVISQLYGAGGLAGAASRNDFVELHNRGTTPISVNGMSIQYASAAGTTWLNQTNLSGTIPAGGYYLIREASDGTTGTVLPTPDATGTINMSVSTGKLALVASQTPLSGACPLGGSVIDFVGYGPSATCNEGGTNAPSPSLTTSIARFQAGCADLNLNGSDFAVGTPTPRNSASAASVCACVARNESSVAAEADYCATVFPLTLTLQTGTSTGSIFGQLFEAGLTEPGGPAASVRAQLGWGPPTANPEYQPGWSWFGASYNVQAGNNDEYQASFTAPAVGSYRYVYRFSLDQGVSWTYCDDNAGDFGAGSNPGLTFDVENWGVLTVTP